MSTFEILLWARAKKPYIRALREVATPEEQDALWNQEKVLIELTQMLGGHEC